MNLRYFALIACLFLAACAEEDIKVTGITREKAIFIAQSACKEYPDRFSYMDYAEWDRDGHYWVVELTDRSGDIGRAYKINRSGTVVDTHDISAGRDSRSGREWYNQ